MNHKMDILPKNTFYKKIFEQSPNPMSVVRASDGVHLEINNAFRQNFGWTRRQVIGNTAREIGLILPEDADLFLKGTKKTGRARNLPVRMLDKNGEFRHQLVSTSLIKIQNHFCHLANMVDLSPRCRHKKETPSDDLIKAFDWITGTGVAVISGFEKKKPLVLYVNHEAKLLLGEYPLNRLIVDLKKKEALFLEAHARYYQVRIVRTQDHSPLKLMIMERQPDMSFIKEKLKKYDLTHRQREAALLSATGHSNGEIAQKLNICEYTVKDHIKEVFKAVGVRNRCELFPKLLGLR
jgi:PAS domain S-box-containing protein